MHVKVKTKSSLKLLAMTAILASFDAGIAQANAVLSQLWLYEHSTKESDAFIACLVSGPPTFNSDQASSAQGRRISGILCDAQKQAVIEKLTSETRQFLSRSEAVHEAESYTSLLDDCALGHSQKESAPACFAIQTKHAHIE